MNWKPKKGVGKTLYAIDTWNYNFNSSTPYSAWTSDIHYPTIVKYTDVIIITNGPTKRSTFIVAKKKGDTEYKTYDAANKELDDIKSICPSAYVKYSGEHK